MNKKIFFVFFLMALPIMVNAENCANQALERLKLCFAGIPGHLVTSRYPQQRALFMRHVSNCTAGVVRYFIQCVEEANRIKK